MMPPIKPAIANKTGRKMNAPIPNIDLIPAGKAFGVPAGARDMMGTTKSASRSPRKRVEHGANHATAQYSDTLDLYHHRSLSGRRRGSPLGRVDWQQKSPPTGQLFSWRLQSDESAEGSVRPMEINSKSVLIDPDFHDGLLTGVILDRGTLELRLTDINEKSWSLIVPQILALSATNLLKANIVYEIEFFHKNKLTFEVGDSLDVSYFGENLKDVANAVAEGTLTVMRISTSFGVDLVTVSTAPLSEVRITSLQ